MKAKQTKKVKPLFSKEEAQRICVSQPTISIWEKLLQIRRSLGVKIEKILKEI
jgi:hypothetical protein